MLLYRIGWAKMPVFRYDKRLFSPSTTIAIIIPARNEGSAISDCLSHILAQQYPAGLMEIIVVDDHSEDDTVAKAQALGERIQVLKLEDAPAPKSQSKAYKKQALTAGILASKAELIITTDADCQAPEYWIASIVALYERTRPRMIVGPVAFHHSITLSGIFQSIDFTCMQGITAAARQLKLGNMANGANLAFSRQAFDQVNGYQDIDHLASGDDFLLLHKMQQQFRGQISYLKSSEAIVRTAAQPDWSSFLQQRIRWASKSGKYNDHRLTAILILVYLFNLSLLLGILFAFWIPGIRTLITSLLVLKIGVELIFLIPVSGFYSTSQDLWYFPFLQILHICYIVMAGFLGMKGTYRWKGRKVR